MTQWLHKVKATFFVRLLPNRRIVFLGEHFLSLVPQKSFLDMGKATTQALCDFQGIRGCGWGVPSISFKIF